MPALGWHSSILFPGRRMGVRGRASEQADVLLVKLFLVEIFLDFDENFAHVWLVAWGPRQCVTVGSPVVDFHINVELLPLGDDVWIEPCDGGEFVPEIIRFRIFRDVLRRGSRALSDLRDQAFLHTRLDGNVHGSKDDTRQCACSTAWEAS